MMPFEGGSSQLEPRLGSISVGKGTYIYECKEMQTSYQSSMASEEDRKDLIAGQEVLFMHF